MGTAETGDSELIRLTMIDFFTGEMLINRFVVPGVRMAHWNTRYSGVTWPLVKAAMQNGEALRGRDAAREAVFRFVSPETVVVGHSLQNDFAALRWIHNRVVDTFLSENEEQWKERVAEKKRLEEQSKKNKKKGIELNKKKQENKTTVESSGSTGLFEGGDAAIAHKVEGEKVGGEQAEEKKKKTKGSGPFSLKTLAKTRLGRDIQMVGNKGHDSYEDALASRDLAHWLVVNRPKATIFTD